MGDYGIKIAKAGSNINSTDPEDYHFWSKYRNKSIKTLVSLEVTTNSGTDQAAVTTSYNHAFGYIPQHMAFVLTQINGDYINCDYDITTSYGNGGDNQYETMSVYATSSHIYVTANNYYYTPMAGTYTNIVDTYTFDVILFMEEVETT